MKKATLTPAGTGRLLCDQVEEVTLAEHTKHVEEFLNEMYATMIDPVEQPSMKVAELCALLLRTAREQREAFNRASPNSPQEVPTPGHKETPQREDAPTYADLLCEVEVLRQIVKVNKL